MGKQKTEWSSPPVIISIIGLLISLSANFIQYRQNITNNTIAAEATEKANMEEERADDLQKKKDTWYANMNNQLNEINDEIRSATDNLKTADLSKTLTISNESVIATRQSRMYTDELADLEAKKAILEKQLNDFLSTYK